LFFLVYPCTHPIPLSASQRGAYYAYYQQFPPLYEIERGIRGGEYMKAEYSFLLSSPPGILFEYGK